MPSKFDSTFDRDPQMVNRAEELAMREAMLVLRDTGTRLRSQERNSRRNLFSLCATAWMH